MENDANDVSTNDNHRLTRNVITNDKILGFNKRNVIEALLFTSIFLICINLIPFTKVVRFFTSLVLGIAMFLFFLKGFKHRSITQMISKEYRFKKNRRRLHLRSPEYVRKKVKSSYAESEDESIAEHYFKYVKDYIERFIEQYSEEENSK